MVRINCVNSDTIIAMKEYDLLVIGGGSGGVRAARLAATMGKKVLLAEKAALGGTCVNVGCVPKKLFVFASSYPEEVESAAAYGWTNASIGELDWNTLRENKNREITRLNNAYSDLLSKSGAEVIQGEARLTGEQTATIQTADGAIEVHADKILLASGAAPTRPNLSGAELGVLSDDMFFLPALPKRAAVIGGGYIALEFAGILSGLGVETTICYRADLPLRGFDDDLRAHLANEIAKRGVAIHAGVAPTGLRQNDDELLVDFAEGEPLAADLVLLATGRTPQTATLGLENTKAVADKRGFLMVDENYCVANCQHLYAIGDIIETLALTPVATAEAGVFVSRIYGGEAKTIDYTHIPTAVFSRPPLATAGMSEAAATKQGFRTKIYKSEFRAMRRGFAGKDWQMLMKLVVDEASGRVLGAHLVGDDAGEIIQGIAIAVRMGATKADFDSTIGVHPTSAEEFVTMRDSN
ncbi:MAG: glutathione-disulfide reductase [Gammaproteobacteria bacterium WSBS_2016_MAG_OTU1]